MPTFNLMTSLPEPGGLAILGSGFIAIALILRRRFTGVVATPSSKESTEAEVKRD